MQYRIFGKLGWNISEIGFGGWAIGGDMWGAQDDIQSIQALHEAIDRGVNFIDTAQGYGKGHSEELIGAVLKERKEEIYVATKIPATSEFKWPVQDDANADISFPAKYIIEECHKSLKRLKRDYIDIYQFHTWAAKFNVYDEWFEALSKLKDEGKIRAIGVSVPDTKPDSVIGSLVNGRVDAVQVVYNIFERYPEWNLFPVCEAHGIGVIARVPFDEGALTGKYTEETKFPEGDMRNFYFRGSNLKQIVKRVKDIEKFKNLCHPSMPMAEYALRFCLSADAVNVVIPGMRNVKQAGLNTGISDGKYLDKNELKELEKFVWRKDFWFEEPKEA